MSDLQKHIQERRAYDPEFREGFDSGYVLFKRLYQAKTLPEPVTAIAVFKKTSEGYTGFLRESPNIRAKGSTLEQARLNLEAEIFLMFDTHCSLIEILPEMSGSDLDDEAVNDLRQARSDRDSSRKDQYVELDAI